MRPIDADAFAEKLSKEQDGSIGCYKLISKVINLIVSTPTIEPRRGWWEICEDDDGMYGVCSECGEDADFNHYGISYNFCPHCGADMRGETDEEA